METDKLYFKIDPDFEGCLGYYSGDKCCYGCDNDTLELDGYESTPFVVPGLEAWCWEWDEQNYNAIHGIEDNFNWSDWHYRGICLAVKLRNILPNEIDLMYRFGTHDIMILGDALK